MNRHLTHRDDLPLFMPTNNAGMVVGRIEFDNGASVTFRPSVLVDDKPIPSDIQERVARNAVSKKEPVEVRAAQWMKQYPQVYAAFEKAAFAEAEFTKRGSAKFIAECLRRHRDLVAGKPFKIPNAYVTYMALRFMDENPAFDGLFKSNKRKLEV